jgi:hypothetical protein
MDTLELWSVPRRAEHTLAEQHFPKILPEALGYVVGGLKAAKVPHMGCGNRSC